jgi:phage gpG-like protein
VIEIKLEITGVKETVSDLATIAAQMKDFRPFWPGVARVFFEEQRRLFDSQGAGSWAALSPRYAARKLREYPSTGILERTGNLRRSLVSQMSPDSAYLPLPQQLTLGTRVPYARYHATGTKHMPARPPIIVTESEVDEMATIIRDGLKETARRLGLEVR